LDYDPQQNVTYNQQKMGVYATAWAEIGLSYGRIVYQEGKSMINAGITAKYLMGIGHMSAYLDELNHTVVSDEDWNVTNLTGQYAITEPGVATGHGFAVDLGVTYKRMLEDVDDYAPHTAQTRTSPANWIQVPKHLDPDTISAVQVLELVACRFFD
jgi:hypothetical protein